ncbi:MAG TPA: glycogen-binding domain-containing protein [Planctomycetota bacterium]|nr:glycogen-binding domain-containing protein [Planctomycetota bacterium]
MPKVKESTKARTRKVRFTVTLPQADEVALTGDFTQWTPEGIPLHHDGQQEWYIHLDLAPGDYQYRLRVDGEWRDHPEASRKVPNPFGTQNCVLTVD